MHKDAIDIALPWVILAGDLVTPVRLASGALEPEGSATRPYLAGPEGTPLGCREEEAGFLSWF